MQQVALTPMWLSEHDCSMLGLAHRSTPFKIKAASGEERGVALVRSSERRLGRAHVSEGPCIAACGFNFNCVLFCFLFWNRLCYFLIFFT